jgi:5-(carboxyamino)imidazole ribonucleotide synthase
VAEGRWALPLVWKLAEGGYDGFGVSLVRRPEDLDNLPEQPCIAESLVDIAEEIGVIVARHPDGSMATFPPVAMEFHPSANQVEFVVCPAPLTAEALAEAEELARRAASALGILGLLAVELFYTRDGQWLINEVAPRPHNSGHLTIEGCETSQFEQLLRCATGLPLGSTALRQPTVMANVVGAEGHHGPVAYEGLEPALSVPGTRLHLYGKSETRPFRKLGHWTAVGKSLDEARSRAAAARNALTALSHSPS